MAAFSRNTALASLTAGVVLLVAAAGLLIAKGDFPAAGTPTAGVTIGGPFRLTTMNGGTLSNDDLKGEPFAIFFGFTRCPEICPTTLTELASLMQRLGPDADRMHFVFVSLDPTRDTPDVLKQYIGAFDPRIIGLTGTEPDVAKAAKEYRVFWEKVPTGRRRLHAEPYRLGLPDGQARHLYRCHRLPGKPRHGSRQAEAAGGVREGGEPVSTHPLRTVCLTFLSGATSAALLVAGVVLLDLENAKALLDYGGDGLGARDVVAVVWIFGNFAVLARHVLPAILRA